MNVFSKSDAMKFLYNYLLWSMVMLSALLTHAQQPADTVPAHTTFTLQSQPLAEVRVINVWLPDNYVQDAKPLPVLYMPDGGVKEDFPHIANTLASLIRTGKIPPVMLVGIENTQRRRDLTGPTEVEKDKTIAPVVGGSAQFRAFIALELMPEIERRYHTNEKKAIIGESLAGLFVTETFLLEPCLFDVYIAFDPSLWWNGGKLLGEARAYLDKQSPSGKAFWFAASGAKDIYGNAGKLATVFKERNSPGFLWEYLPARKEKHHTIFRATKETGLIWALSKL